MLLCWLAASAHLRSWSSRDISDDLSPQNTGVPPRWAVSGALIPFFNDYHDGVVSKHFIELAHAIQHKMSRRDRAYGGVSDHHRAGVERGGMIHFGRDLTRFIAGESRRALAYTAGTHETPGFERLGDKA
jgi:hypothetical protein